ncbi:MAG: glycosyltransferase [Chloroflexi bacterium]|nr:glycosyltransferase [Chloroflexota bacterium]
MGLVFLSLLLSAVLCGALVLSQRWHGRYTFDQVDGVQRMHTNRVSRIGGLAIFTTLIVTNGWFSASASYRLISTMLIMGSFIFTFGFLEDITKKVGVTLRMWASLLPGFIAYLLTDEYLVSLDFAWLNAILGILPIGLVFTAFAISGMTHAINFLDGLNGLSAWTSLWILTGLATLAVMNSSAPELVPILMLMGALIGFLIWNWPFGKLFLGDGGAYLIGMCLAWLAISLSIHNPSITSWSMLLLCAYPITEVLYSMYRRITTRRRSGNPDRAHH